MTDGILKPGDPCPCCGQPIKTSDPETLLLLSWIAWVKSEKSGPKPEKEGMTDEKDDGGAG